MTALPHELLERHEAAQAGKLSEEQQRALEQAIAEIPDGRQLAADYRRLW